MRCWRAALAAAALCGGLVAAGADDPARAGMAKAGGEPAMVAVRAPFTPEARRAPNRAGSGIDAYWTPARMRLADVLARPTEPTESTGPTGGSGKPASARHPRASGVSRMAGKIFYRNAANGRDYSCSGWVVRGGSGDLVGTAGHCVYDALSGWHRNWVFVPAFDHGRRPYGIWRAAWMVTFRGWVRHAQPNRDVAFVKVRPSGGMRPSGGKSLAGMVGGYRILTGFPSRKRRLAIIGYPFLPPYPGDRQYRCAGVASPADPGPRPRLRLPCRLTTGASGGPWVEGSASATAGYVDGITTRTNLANTMLWSPPFDDGVRDLYRYADRR